MSTKIFSLILLSVCLCTASITRHGGGPVRPCCVKYTPRNVSSKVTGDTYKEQHAGLGCVHAIIFSSDDGQICANPNDKWVKELTANMKKI
ncbi:C-C motif chemokine 21-like [Parambassis ranga]|uniref:C-C motif chemokine 21-like n=1 Tax=Parambassis ranga TaxID=210632 RepID=A0A6P7KF57_9TELE|nr:C-C motif chemokine 21-like [Parambassis ranga]